MKKFILAFFAASALCSAAAQVAEIKQPYVAVCLDGKIAAQPRGAKGPVRTLWLLIEGVRPVPCTKGTTVHLDQFTEPSTGEKGEGLRLVGSATFEIKKNGNTVRTMIVGTFQENRVPRNRVEQSI